MRATYLAYAEMDLEAIVKAHHEDVAYHVAGHGPLSGDKVGRDAVLAYMIEISTLTGGRGGFEIRSLAADRDVGMALVRATAWAGQEEFIRDVVHVARISERQIIEFWDSPLDQYAEDDFWTRATTVAYPHPPG